MLRGIVEAAVTLTDAEYGALGIVGDGQKLLEFLPVGLSDQLAARIGQSPCGRGILGELIRHPEPLRLTDLSSHPRSFGFPPHHPPMRTFLGVPVRVRDEVFGNLYLTEKRGGVSFDADDEAVLTTVTDNGIGIPDGDTTAPGTRTAIDGGTGTAINNGDQPARRVGGLDNMRTRAELCGGTLAIERPTDGGTRITWRVPLHD